MVRRIILALTIMFACMSFGLSMSPQPARAGTDQVTIEAPTQLNSTAVIEYRWFCYNTPQLTYNLQWVNAARYKRTVVYESFASGRILYAGPWIWVQNAWQWFCPQY